MLKVSAPPSDPATRQFAAPWESQTLLNLGSVLGEWRAAGTSTQTARILRAGREGGREREGHQEATKHSSGQD